MKKKTSLFLGTTLFSYYGDIIAAMSIPLLLYKQSNNLIEASTFTLMAILTTMLVSRPSALLLKKFHPLKIIFYSDLIGVFLLAILAFYSFNFKFELLRFLFICFFVALAVNFPMFAKNQLLYQYFIPKNELKKTSTLQGKLIGLVFVLSVLSVGAMLDSVGFAGVIVFDIFTYLPLLVIAWFYRAAEKLGYDDCAEPKNRSSLIKANQNNSKSIGIYYFFNASTYFFFTLRSHLLLSVLLSYYREFSLTQICLAAAGGTLLSIFTDGITLKYLSNTSTRSAWVIALFIFFIGILFNYRDSWIPILIVGFLLSEITSISLKAQRVKQVIISSFYPETRLATLSIISGSLTSAILIPLFITLIHYFGLSSTFVFISCLFLVGSLLVSAIKRNVKFC
ncbi:MAG: hypothetical protein QE271_06965 [Bacteriovoracaceae bacterium]|nr:hypothetical protein [Bacteriovoracaceae bacterium]